MTDKPKIFDVDFNTIFDNAVSDWEAETGFALERFDAERLMLQNFSNSIHYWGNNWLQASAENYLPFMTGERLDIYGGIRAPRLSATPSGAWVKINFVSALETFVPLNENLTVTGVNDEGTFTFKTLALVMAEKGDDSKLVWVEEFQEGGTNNGALANNIPIGDINTLVDPDGIYTGIIDSVENIGESFGGHASEDDTHYQSRLMLKDSEPSTAGPISGYVSKSLKAHHKVLDVGVLKPKFEIDLYVLPSDFSDLVLGDASVQIDNLVLTGLTLANTDKGRLYWTVTGTTPTRVVSIYSDSLHTTLEASYSGANGVGVSLTSAPGSTVGGTFDLTGATDDTDAANYIDTHMLPVSAVNQLYNPDVGESIIRPINDIVNVYICEEQSFTISKCDIEITTGNKETIEAQVTQLINIYRSVLRSKAGKKAVVSQIKGPIIALPGVYDVDIEFNSNPALKEITIDKSKYLVTTVPTINITVVE